jgi:uncharacterized protein YjiS (DUF1127 family)
MEENAFDTDELPTLDRRRRGGGSGAARSTDATSRFLRPTDRLPATVWVVSARTFDLVVPQGSPLWAWPDVPLPQGLPRDGDTPGNAPPGTIRRIIAAIRVWRRHARSRQELRELSDHMLKDIGLRREDVGYPLAPPLWYRD